MGFLYPNDVPHIHLSFSLLYTLMFYNYIILYIYIFNHNYVGCYLVYIQLSSWLQIRTLYLFVEVQYILDTVNNELNNDIAKKFIYVEQAYFTRWWNELHDSQKHAVKNLVNNGGLTNWFLFHILLFILFNAVSITSYC